MRNSLSKIFLKSPGQWWFWILLALIVKGGLLLFQFTHADHGPYSGLWGSTGGDTQLYLEPIDHLIDSGAYDPDYRMPGYGIFYFLLRFCFSKIAALNVMILLQYLMAALSVYVLALTARSVFKQPALFYITYYLFLISTYSNLEDGALLTESFSASFLIFSVYAAVKWYETEKGGYLIFSGIILTEVIFLRPVYAPLLLLFGLFIVYNGWNRARGVFIKYLVLFMLPFLLIDGAWMARNYKTHGRIIPLATVTYLKGANNRLWFGAMDFMQSWGGNYISWDPAAEVRYFNIREKISTGHKAMMNDNYKPIPPAIYTSSFSADSLLALRNIITQIQTDTDIAAADKKIDYAVSRFELYGASIKREHPFIYYIEAPAKMCRVFFIHSGTYNLFPKGASELNKFELLIKIFYSLFYILSLIAGFTGLLLLVRKTLSGEPVILVTGILAYTVVIYPVVLRLCEARYFMPAWPFLLVCVAYCMYLVQVKVLNKKS